MSSSASSSAGGSVTNSPIRINTNLQGRAGQKLVRKSSQLVVEMTPIEESPTSMSRSESPIENDEKDSDKSEKIKEVKGDKS